MRQGLTPASGDAPDRVEGGLLSDSSVVAAFTVAADGTLRSVNRRFVSLLGAESESDLRGKALVDLLADPRDWLTLRDSALTGGGRDVTLAFFVNGRSVTLRGDLDPVTDGGKLDGAADRELRGIFTDVTEETRLREALQRSARMEALGSLTSGIAHDFNNLLTVLVGNLYLVAEELRDQPKTFAKLKSARDAAKRGSDLIRQLLSFARRESVQADTVDPADVIENVIPLIRRALGARITLSADLQPGAGTVHCNAAQLESVLVNLSVNARDAIENSGKVVVTLANVRLTPEAARARGLEPGEFVRISVVDDGPGIPRQALERVFEPFFTTKGERGGTGLGLSMVRWFAEQARGAAYIDSEAGKGTTVSLLLPRSADATAETSVKTMPLSTLPSGSESVLVFSRDEGLRSTISQILEVLGYTVRLCAEPADVLTTLGAANVDLLLIDGAAQQAPAQRHLLRQARTHSPGLKFIVATDGSDASRARVPDGVALLGKPFSLAELAGTVRKVLR